MKRARQTLTDETTLEDSVKTSHTSDDNDQVDEAFRDRPSKRTGDSTPRATTIRNCPIQPPKIKGPHMWFQTTQVEHLYTITQCLRSLLTNTEIVFSPHGMRIANPDPTHICFVDLRITVDTLEEGIYICNHDYRIAVDMDEFGNHMKMAKRDEFLVYELRGADPDYLHLRTFQDTRIGNQAIRLNNPEEDHSVIPPLQYRNQISMLSNEFKDVINLFKTDSTIKHVTLEKTPLKFSIKAENMRGTFCYDYYADEDETVRIQNDPDDKDAVLSGKFSLNKLINFARVTKATKYVNINLPELTEDGETTKPLRIKYDLAALGDITFLLAPYVDAESV